ncbi:DUF6585 family protein [Streptomyces sp. NRRL S-646]|uniref:DUF6585 family protein n=1 Tax=Streptomyces sp. NRRL S-646 TaxID=1463917 RepID=UPI0004C7CFD6|nr:DUF6585 family protein [Streptomyces sp. NRRL S-646]
MSGGSARERAEQLVLARISEAAGRARLGRRRATYPAPTASKGRVTYRLARAGGREGTAAGSRLDFYEHGMTVAVDGRIHAIRYDTTVVRLRRVLSLQGITRALALVDTDGERILVRCGDFGHPQVWGPKIRRAVTAAQVPQALDALARGARLTFGPVWITAGEIGSRKTSLQWSRVQQITILKGAVVIRVAGRWQVLSFAASGIPNPFVFHALTGLLAG